MAHIVCFGEILMRLSPPGSQRFAQCQSLDIEVGGAEANVAQCLAQWGHDLSFVTAVPANAIGARVINQLRSFGVGTDFIARRGQRLGLYYLEQGSGPRASQVIYDRGQSSFSTWQHAPWADILESAQRLHVSGISPAVSEAAAEMTRQALKEAHRRGLPVSFDMNYRRKLWQWGSAPSEVVPELLRHCSVVIGSDGDLVPMLGLKPVEDPGMSLDERREACQDLAQQFFFVYPQCQTLALTLRTTVSASHTRYSAMLWHKQEAFQSRDYDIQPIVDRIGSGDAFSAGLIHGLVNWPEDPARSLNFATAAAVFKHSVVGDINLAEISEIEALADGQGLGRVAR